MPFGKIPPDDRDASGRVKKDHTPRKRTKKEKDEFNEPVDGDELLESLQKIVRADVNRLIEAAQTRELNLMETKQLEIYTRLVISANRKKATTDFSNLSTDELLEIARGGGTVDDDDD